MLDIDQRDLLRFLASAQIRIVIGDNERFLAFEANDGAGITDATGVERKLRMTSLLALQEQGLVRLTANSTGYSGVVTTRGLDEARRVAAPTETAGLSEREILLDLLKLERAGVVRRNDFRRRHVGSRAVIDAMLEWQLIEEDSNLYFITRHGLVEVGGDEAEDELGRALHVAAFLGEQYWDNIGKEFACSFVRDRLSISIAEASRAVRVLQRVPGLQPVRGTSGVDADGAIDKFRLNESIVDVTAEALRRPQPAFRSSFSSTPRQDEVRLQLQHFEVLEQLGIGRNGSVHRGRDTALNDEVALKFLSLSREQVLGTRRQASVQAQQKHPNIVRIRCLGLALHPQTKTETECIVMDFIKDAMPLDDWLGMGGGTLEQGMRMCRQILDALQSIHASGTFHGDVHDGNVLLERNLNVQVIDMHHLKATEGASTATRASLVRTDCYRTWVLMSGVLFRCGLSGAALRSLEAVARSANTLEPLADWLDTQDGVTEGSAPVAVASTRLRTLLDAGRLPALNVVSPGSKSDDTNRTTIYEVAVQRLDEIPFIHATAIGTDGKVASLSNLLRAREDTLRTTLAFGNDESAAVPLAVRIKLNSGEIIQYRFRLAASWNGALTSDRIGLDFISGGDIVE
ncbi:MAG TPA: protein kinase, partial [Myxococcota bacterium]